MLEQIDYKYVKPSRDLKHIPGRKGFPWIGSGLKVLNSPKQLLFDMCAEYGMVFRSHSFGVSGVMLLGADANRFVLTDQSSCFSNYQGWYPAIGSLFPGSLMLRDFDDHKAHRTLMRSAFTSQALLSYLPRVKRLVRNIMDGWIDRGEVMIYPEMKRIALIVAASIFFELEDDEIETFALPLLKELTQASSSVVRIDRFGTQYNRGHRARKVLVEFLERKLKSPSRANAQSDLMRELRNGTIEGQGLTNEEIVDHLLFMLVAAHDTTASAMATTLHFVANDKILQERLHSEIESVGEITDDSSLDRLEIVERCLKESLRILPPLPTLPRRTTREIEYGGYVIPENVVVSVSPLHTHHMPELWLDPDKFDIDRFSSERAEHRKHSHMWVPFGSGPHICIGMQFAYLEAKIVFTELLSRFRISYPVSTPFNPVYYPFPYPSGQIAVNIVPR